MLTSLYDHRSSDFKPVNVTLGAREEAGRLGDRYLGARLRYASLPKQPVPAGSVFMKAEEPARHGEVLLLLKTVPSRT